MANDSIKSRYAKLAQQRDTTYLDRARKCAEVTLPMLVPPTGGDASTAYATPYQSFGARAVNNLASKLLLVLLPPAATSSFFRLTIDEMTLEKLSQQEGMRAEIEESLSRIERVIGVDLESTGTRAILFEAIKYMLVAGNVLLVERDDGTFKMFRLENYVCKRAPSGAVVELITHEKLSRAEMPPEMVALLAAGTQAGTADEYADNVDLHTRCQLVNGQWVITQELNELSFGNPTTEPVEKGRYLALAPMIISGEDYSRSYVEEYLGDLFSLEGLSKSLLFGAAIAAKIVHLVAPNAVTSVDDLNEAESGDYIVGKKDDVTTLQLEKYADFNFVQQQAQQLERRLGLAFLMNSAVQRDGERVTAEEIRYMAGELEQSLGGIYTSLAQSFQRPLVVKRMARLQKQGKLPPLPEGAVKVTITTGVEGLGRNADLMKLDMVFNDVAKLGEIGLQYLNFSDFLKRRMAALGVDSKGLVYTQEEIEKKQAAAQQAQMQQQVAPIAAEAAMSQE